MNSFKLSTNTALKEVIIDDDYYKNIPLQRVNKYQVARVHASLTQTKNGEPILTFSQQSNGVQVNKPSLFFRENNDYSLRELQKFLLAHNFQTILLDGSLNFQGNVMIDIKNDQIRFTGNMCKEYF